MCTLAKLLREGFLTVNFVSSLFEMEDSLVKVFLFFRKALQEAQEKQQLLIKQKLELENKLQNNEKDLKKVS